MLATVRQLRQSLMSTLPKSSKNHPIFNKLWRDSWKVKGFFSLVWFLITASWSTSCIYIDIYSFVCFYIPSFFNELPVLLYSCFSLSHHPYFNEYPFGKLFPSIIEDSISAAIKIPHSRRSHKDQKLTENWKV